MNSNNLPLVPKDFSSESVTTYFQEALQALEAEMEALDEQEPGDKALAAFENLRQQWIGRKSGLLTTASGWIKQVPPDAKKSFGVAFNLFKGDVEERLQRLEHRVQDAAASKARLLEGAAIDVTLPGIARRPGIPHPLLTTMDRVVEVFHHLGYSTSLGPQVESDFYNFEALNFPENHPARDTQDTLQIAGQQSKPSRDRLLMRTHTSPVQIRTMVAQAPPLRIVIPGKVHRNDAADATHSPIFHQVEGLCVDTNITFSDLKGTLDHAMRALFGSAVKTRFFPSFFPFTEPSADVQISCPFCGGKGCRKCKHSGWIELLGCGMVDPAVFEAVTVERRRLGLDDTPYDPARISGFAFGMGVERIAMMLHGVSDIGQFYSGDMRFLEQFA
jgi:phenylalanyl-tRNA synthetase alpha chain